MAAVNFPTPTDLNPSTGQTFAEGWYNPDNGVTYVNDNNVWSAAKTPSQSFDDRYVEVTGDNMTGALTLGPNGGPAVTTLAADGSASFAGQMEIGNDIASGNGTRIYDNGAIYLRSDVSSDNSIFKYTTFTCLLKSF